MPYPYQEGTTLSAHIIAAIRTHRQLKGSLKFTALEIAHRASSSGFVRVSYGYLASKTGLTIQTMITHVKRLEALGILKKQRMWISPSRCAVNVYHLLVRAVPRRSTQICGEKLPEAREERDKSLALGEEIRLAERGLQFLTPGSIAYQSAWAHLERLRGLSSPP